MHTYAHITYAHLKKSLVTPSDNKM